MIKAKDTNVWNRLCCLTLLFLIWQTSFFLIHYHVSDLIDSLVNASIVHQLINSTILLPLISFVCLQILAYVLFILWIGFISISLGELFKLSKLATNWLAIFIWFLSCFFIMQLNKYYYPESFFASLMNINIFSNDIIFVSVLSLFCIMTLLSYINFFYFKRHLFLGSILLFSGFCAVGPLIYDAFFHHDQHAKINAQPNIIFIGLDSLRPDFIGFYGDKNSRTNNLDDFLKSSVNFSQAYTPLARTYPAWISILTSKYPKHSEARNNLINPELVLKNETLSRKLQQLGYFTIYATDEKRFSNITKEYGFDRILGPKMGVNDFVLGSLSDFPLTNLMINLPISRFLFPYNYGNRGAAITYRPNSFLKIVKTGLTQLPDKPVFLAIHLCLSHWPFIWSHKGSAGSSYLPTQYRESVNRVDKQFGSLMQMLKENGLLENSIVVILSDHGTGLGIPGDRVISEKNYQGDKNLLKLVPSLKLSSSSTYSVDHENDFTINTAYGQGNNVLSLTQNHVLLAFKRYGNNFPHHQVNEKVSLLDIAPTVLNLLSLKSLDQVDGSSLLNHLVTDKNPIHIDSPFFMETGDSMGEIETDHIYIEKVVKHKIGIYSINPDGLLYMNPPAAHSILKNKQLAVMWNDWLLAYFPATTQRKLEKDSANPTKLISIPYKNPSYFVLVNLKNGQWTMSLSSSLAKQAPTKTLLGQLQEFYKTELTI